MKAPNREDRRSVLLHSQSLNLDPGVPIIRQREEAARGPRPSRFAGDLALEEEPGPILGPGKRSGPHAPGFLNEDGPRIRLKEIRLDPLAINPGAEGDASLFRKDAEE
jgi:hypothetical protein